MNQQTKLNILQYNVRKPRDIVTASLLRDPQVHEYDILAIQEPWRNPFMATTHHPAKDKFYLCCPAGDEEGPVRVCFFVNKRIDYKKSRFKEHTRDICSLIIKTNEERQDRQQITIHYIYNPIRSTTGERTTLANIRRNQSNK